MWILSVNQSPKPEKKLKATFCRCERKNACKGSNHKVVHFGSKGSSTFIDHKDQKKKDAYLSRHKVNEDPTSAGALSRWLLWNKESLSASISDFKKRFKL